MLDEREKDFLDCALYYYIEIASRFVSLEEEDVMRELAETIKRKVS